MIEVSIKGHSADDVITSGRAAFIIGVTDGYLTILRRRGTGPKFSKPDGYHVAYRVGDLVEWLEGQFVSKHRMVA